MASRLRPAGSTAQQERVRSVVQFGGAVLQETHPWSSHALVGRKACQRASSMDTAIMFSTTAAPSSQLDSCRCSASAKLELLVLTLETGSAPGLERYSMASRRQGVFLVHHCRSVSSRGGVRGRQ